MSIRPLTKSLFLKGKLEKSTAWVSRDHEQLFGATVKQCVLWVLSVYSQTEKVMNTGAIKRHRKPKRKAINANRETQLRNSQHRRR